jgi:curved DNA-binding protein
MRQPPVQRVALLPELHRVAIIQGFALVQFRTAHARGAGTNTADAPQPVFIAVEPGLEVVATGRRAQPVMGGENRPPGARVEDQRGFEAAVGNEQLIAELGQLMTIETHWLHPPPASGIVCPNPATDAVATHGRLQWYKCSMEFRDYYEIMGVSRDATQDDIKRAYRKLARKYHPDVSTQADAEARFKEVGEAYEVLRDPEKRAAYDQLGKDWKQGQEFRPPPDWDAGFEFRGGGFSGGESADFSEFFETLFGRGARGPGFGGFQGAARRARGEDHHAKVLVSLEDSYAGATRGITLQVPELTADGHVRTRARALNVKIPKGIRAGQQIRLTGQGGPGLGDAPAGDLYLEVEFEPHPIYRVDGADVYLDLPLAPWEAALGATVKVPTPTGLVELKIPAGSQPGARMRLKGKGLPARTPGDLYVVLQVALPPADSPEARALYEQMRERMEFRPRAKLGV